MKKLNKNEWDELWQNNKYEYRDRYLEFINNIKNSHCCEFCPENGCFSSWQDRLPCGQWRCWVNTTCK